MNDIPTRFSKCLQHTFRFVHMFKKPTTSLHPLYEAESSLAHKLMKIGAWTFLGMVANVNMPTNDLVN